MSIFEDFLNKEHEEKPEIEEKVKKIKFEKKQKTKQEIDINQIFTDLALTSEFKRLIYKAIVGKVHRGSKEDLDKKLAKVLEKIRK